MQEPQTSRQDWPENGRINDPESVPINDPMNEALNDRQRWFLARVGAGNFCRADDISADWKVSLKTARRDIRSEEHTSELQSLMRISYAVFCLKKKTKTKTKT